MKCGICAASKTRLFSAVLMGKHEVSYFYCESCGFLQTEKPYWLDEAYQVPIAISDTGIIQRNITIANSLSVILFLYFKKRGKYLDVAGGYGLLVRMMRDVGFDFFWVDKFCKNLFSKGFERETGVAYEAVTAFEVMEHIVDPVGFISDALNSSRSKTFIFTTELFSGRPPDVNSWWYYSLNSGQHISFYQARTLKIMASKLNLNYYSNGLIHIFTNKILHPIVIKVLTNSRLAHILSMIIRLFMGSKTMSDHYLLVSK